MSGDISHDCFMDGKDNDFGVESDIAAALIPKYEWEVEALPSVWFRAVDRPSWWHRLCFRVFFGWQWIRILAAKDET